MNNKNLLKVKKYFWNIQPKYNINITPEEYIEYLAQKDIINQLCNFINTHGYTIKKMDNTNDFYIEKNNIPTEYEEENNEV